MLAVVVGPFRFVLPEEPAHVVVPKLAALSALACGSDVNRVEDDLWRQWRSSVRTADPGAPWVDLGGEA